MIKPNFQKAILNALSTLPSGYSQRIDGLQCENGVIDHDWLFFRLRLWWLEKRGLIGRIYKNHSILQSANGLPFFFITNKGRVALGEVKP